MFCADVIITTRESLSASLPSSVSSLIEFRRLHLLSCFDLCFHFQDAEASYDLNDRDEDPLPRYDSRNENK